MFESSYNDLKFTVQKHTYFFIQKHNYFFTNLIAAHPLFSLLNVVPVFSTLHFHIIPWQLNLLPWFWLPCICWWYQICISSSELWSDLHISRCLLNFSGCIFACEIPLYREQANILPFSTESPKFVPLPVLPFSLNASVCQSSKLKDLFLTPSLSHFAHLVYHQVLLLFPSYQYHFSLSTPLCPLLPPGQLQ